jgi:hypothetical protein
MFPVMIVDGTTAKVLVGGGLGGACTGVDGACLSSTGGRGSIDAWCAISALRAATIGWRSMAGLELDPSGAGDGI